MGFPDRQPESLSSLQTPDSPACPLVLRKGWTHREEWYRPPREGSRESPTLHVPCRAEHHLAPSVRGNRVGKRSRGSVSPSLLYDKTVINSVLIVRLCHIQDTCMTSSGSSPFIIISHCFGIICPGWPMFTPSMSNIMSRTRVPSPLGPEHTAHGGQNPEGLSQQDPLIS